MIEVKKIPTQQEIIDCPKYYINNFKWNCICKPEAYFQLAYIDEQGFFINMVCIESNPKREYIDNHDPVCKDSAMEAFFSFISPESKIDENFIPDNNDMYINFEMNSNAALYAKYGKGRRPRYFISDEMQNLCDCKAVISNDNWSVSVLLPLKLIDELYGIEKFDIGDTFFCNFYKISESSEIEHYASYNPIVSDTPNFHLPQFFAKAQII